MEIQNIILSDSCRNQPVTIYGTDLAPSLKFVVYPIKHDITRQTNELLVFLQLFEVIGEAMMRLVRGAV